MNTRSGVNDGACIGGKSVVATDVLVSVVCVYGYFSGMTEDNDGKERHGGNDKWVGRIVVL